MSEMPGQGRPAPIEGSADPEGAPPADATTPAGAPEGRLLPELVILSGMSGAGRSTAAHAMEDVGWYVVDNLPPQMLPDLARLAEGRKGLRRLAAVVDARSRDFFAMFEQALTDLHAMGHQPRVVFIDANDESLVRRFESVRRPHPLQGDGRLLDGIRAERDLLADLRADADMLVDTSGLNVHQLSAKVRDAMGVEGTARLRIALVSFGFKYGVPLDADLVFDMRFLPNPFWIPELRPYTGRDPQVADYVLSRPGAQDFVERVVDLMDPMLTGYLAEGRRYITVGIGCTGGKHRSVAISELLGQRLATDDIGTIVFHRDLGRE